MPNTLTFFFFPIVKNALMRNFLCYPGAAEESYDLNERKKAKHNEAEIKQAPGGGL